MKTYGQTRITLAYNTVIKVTEKEIFVQVNCPGSLLHNSLLAFDNINKVDVLGIDGSISVYKIVKP